MLSEAEIELCLRLILRRRRRRRQNARPYIREIDLARDTHGEFAILIGDLRRDDERFFQYFRMNQTRFDHLLSLVSPLLEHSRTHALPVSPEHRLVLTLHLLATGVQQSNAATRFRLGKSTVSVIFAETCKAIWQALKEEYVPWPTKAHFQKIASDFWRTWNFPMCLGAIDGKHVQIRAFPNSGSLCYNYKGTFSVNLMACVDANYKFTMIDVGAYGSEGDSGVFNRSKFGKDIMSGDLDCPGPAKLPGTETVCPHVFVSDEAFPLRYNLMKPYPRANLDDLTRIFNYRLSRCRRIVENAFGILAARWRILLTVIELKPETVDDLIKAIVALHNFLKSTDASTPPRSRYVPPKFVDYEDENGFVVEGEWRTGTTPLRPLGHMGSNNATAAAKAVRESLTDYFMTEDGSVPWQEAAALSC